jgi:chromosome partitioning protein
LYESDRGVDLICAGQELSGFELTVSGISSPRQLILKKFIEKNNLREMYDVIIVDGPPTLGLLVVNILCCSDGLFIPFKPDEFSHKGLSHMEETLENIEDMGVTKTPLILGHIPNLVDPRRKQEEVDLTRILDRYSDGNNKIPPFFNRAPLVKAQAHKRSVFDYGAKEFKSLQEQFGNLAEIVENFDHNS